MSYVVSVMEKLVSRADIIKREQDLSYLAWDESACPSGLTGRCAKARAGRGHNAVYYKMARSGGAGQGEAGLFSQLLCARLMDALGIEHAPFALVRAKVSSSHGAVWVCKSKTYRAAGQRAVTLPYYWELCSLPGESPLDMCVRLGWGHQVAQCMLADYLCAVRDRDETCFEVLEDDQGALILSPILPRAYSLACSFVKETWRYDAQADLGTINYLGSASLESNLDFATSQLGYISMPKGLKKTMFTGLDDVVPKAFADACWHIVEKRWEHYESLCGL